MRKKKNSSFSVLHISSKISAAQSFIDSSWVFGSVVLIVRELKLMFCLRVVEGVGGVLGSVGEGFEGLGDDEVEVLTERLHGLNPRVVV
jgi:hypothetical protein